MPLLHMVHEVSDIFVIGWCILTTFMSYEDTDPSLDGS